MVLKNPVLLAKLPSSCQTQLPQKNMVLEWCAHFQPSGAANELGRGLHGSAEELHHAAAANDGHDEHRNTNLHQWKCNVGLHEKNVAHARARRVEAEGAGVDAAALVLVIRIGQPLVPPLNAAEQRVDVGESSTSSSTSCSSSMVVCAPGVRSVHPVDYERTMVTKVAPGAVQE